MTWSGISRKACKRQARHATSVLSAVMEATPGSAHTSLSDFGRGASKPDLGFAKGPRTFFA